MVTLETTRTEAFSPVAALRTVGGMAAVALGLGGAYALTGIGVPCPLLSVGIYCPFCGGTRMVASALRGDMGAAFHWNPFLFLGSIALLVAVVAWIVEWRGGPALRLPARWGPMTQARLYWAVGATAAVFTVVRNLG